jgi:hypothetical protein
MIKRKLNKRKSIWFNHSCFHEFPPIIKNHRSSMAVETGLCQGARPVCTLKETLPMLCLVWLCISLQYIYIYIYICIRGRRRVSMRNRLWTYSNQLLTKKRYPGMEVVLIAWSYLSCHAGSGFIVNLPKTHHNGINEGVWYNIPMIGSTPGCTSLAACDITKL